MKKLTTLALALSMAIGLSACGNPHQSGSFPDPSAGVQWPTQTINVICPSSAGGGTDNTIRAFTDTWSQQIGQSVVVTNYDATPVAMTNCVYLGVPPEYRHLSVCHRRDRRGSEV